MLVESLDLFYKAAYYGYFTSGYGKVDRELAHKRAMRVLNTIWPYLPKGSERILQYRDPVLEYHSKDRYLSSRFGLAAGLDKTGEFLAVAKMLGVSSAKTGGVPKDSYDGALGVRITADRNNLGLVNWVQLASPGMEAVYRNMHPQLKIRDRDNFEIGVNTVVTKPSIEQDRIVEDFKTVNDFFLERDIDCLESNFGHLATKDYQNKVASDQTMIEVLTNAIVTNKKQIFPKIISVKLSMDTPIERLQNQVKQLIKLGVDEINIGNTTRYPGILRRLHLYYPDQGGGYCGPLAFDLVLPKIEAVSDLCRESETTLTLSAGVDNWKNATRAHIAGADLIQSLHGLIMMPTGGPGFFYRMNRGVAEFVQSIRLENVSDLKDKHWVVDYLVDYDRLSHSR